MMTLHTQLSSALCPGCKERRRVQDITPCNVCGRSNPTIPYSRTLWEKFTDWMLRPLGWFTHSITILLVMWILYLGIGLKVDIEWALAISFCTFIIFLNWGVRLLFVLAFSFFSNRWIAPAIWRRFVPIPALFILYGVLIHFEIPMRLGFWLSHASLESAAKQKASQGKLAGPLFFAGLYPVRYIQRSGNNVRIIVTSNSFMSTSYTGFAKCPNGCKADEFPLPPGDGNFPLPTEYQHWKDDWYWFGQIGNFD